MRQCVRGPGVWNARTAMSGLGKWVEFPGPHARFQIQLPRGPAPQWPLGCLDGLLLVVAEAPFTWRTTPPSLARDNADSDCPVCV